MSGRFSIFLLLSAFLLAGCSGARWLGVRLLYDEVELEPRQVLNDLLYRGGSDLERHRLDLFRPEGSGWPVLVFVPGGRWTGGGKGLLVAGADVYGNIGRFYASRGIGAAIINYRLQPDVTWREQVADVAQAVAWVHDNVAAYGGDAGALFLSGHSAGAQLSAYVALRPEPLADLGLSPELLCGVIPVSGVAFDLADRETYELGADFDLVERRFRAGDPGDDWLSDASATTLISDAAPPFLLIHGQREWKSLQHQNRLLNGALRGAGAQSELLVAKQRHGSIVLALSRDDKLPGTAILEFIQESDC